MLSNFTEDKSTLPQSEISANSGHCEEDCNRMKPNRDGELQSSSETGLDDETVAVPCYRDFSKTLLSYPLRTNDSFCSKFPSKLYRMLSDPEVKDIITWLPHGRGWRILNQEALEAVVLPRYFVNGKYSTFRRQVNGWGFRRIKHRCYYHEMFLRGVPRLCQYMKRMKKEELAKRGKKQPLIDPNFIKQCRLNPMPEDDFLELNHISELSNTHLITKPEDTSMKIKPYSEQSGTHDDQMPDDISIDTELGSDLSIIDLDDIF